jgi:hypothetical protein
MDWTSWSERRELVLRLSAKGMSLRSIAEKLHFNDRTVHQDLKRAGADISAPAPLPAPAVVIGHDGKKYPAGKATGHGGSPTGHSVYSCPCR